MYVHERVHVYNRVTKDARFTEHAILCIIAVVVRVLYGKNTQVRLRKRGEMYCGTKYEGDRVTSMAAGSLGSSSPLTWNMAQAYGLLWRCHYDRES